MSRQVLIENVAATAVAAAPAAAVAEGPGAAPAVRVADVTKPFRSGFARRRLRGVEGVSFSVARGEVYALLGPNGAGRLQGRYWPLLTVMTMPSWPAAVIT